MERWDEGRSVDRLRRKVQLSSPLRRKDKAHFSEFVRYPRVGAG